MVMQTDDRTCLRPFIHLLFDVLQPDRSAKSNCKLCLEHEIDVPIEMRTRKLQINLVQCQLFSK